MKERQNDLLHVALAKLPSGQWLQGAGRYKAEAAPALNDVQNRYKPAGTDKQGTESLPGLIFPKPTAIIQPATADTVDPRTEAYEVALGNARALKKVGAYELARIEYDRAIRLNKKSAPAIQQEKAALLLQEENPAVAVEEEVEVEPVPGSPQWRYDSVVELATRQFAGKRYDSALVHYRLAGQILPEQTFPGSQIRAIEWELAQIWKNYVSARVEQLNKEVRAALAQKNYADALPGLYELLQYKPRNEDWVKTQLANVERLLTNQGVDTEQMRAKVKLLDVWDVIAQNRPDATPVGALTPPAVESGNVPSGAGPGAIPRTRPVTAGSVQTEAIPYPAAQLAELYPNIDFTQMPVGQAFNMIDDPAEHREVFKKVQGMKSSLQLSDSTGNIKVSCEGIYFSKLNTYLKIRIANQSVADFPVGPMLLSWKQTGLRLVDRIPVAVSDFPIVQPGKYFILYYACRNMYLRDSEELYFSVQGRMGFPKWRVLIPGKVYNQEKNKRANYL